MKSKSKKFLSIFAILFALLFAVGLVFGAACKKDKEEEEEEPKHTHTYTSEVTTPATCTEDGVMTYTCVDGDDSYTEVIPATGHSYGEWTGTAATCLVDADRTRTCSVCGDVETDSTKATGHSYKVTFGTWTEDDTEGYTTTVTVTCANDSTEAFVEDTNYTVSITSADGVYTATVYDMEGNKIDSDDFTPDVEGEGGDGGLVVPDDYAGKLIEDATVSVDFSDSSTYSWISGEGVTNNNGEISLEYNNSYSTGVLTLYTATQSDKTLTINGSEAPNALNTSGQTKQNSGVYGIYFSVDLAEYVGDYVTIEIKMASNSDDTTSNKNVRSLFVSSKLEAPDLSGKPGLANATSTGKEDYQTLSYGQVVTESPNILYVTCDASINIYTIDINIYGDNKPSGDQTDPGSESSTTGITLAEGYADEINSWFANPETGLTATTSETDGNVTITVTGTASGMTADEANDFWAGHAVEGDAYIVITVTFQEDETVSWTGSDGVTREKTISDYPDGTFDVVIRISGKDLSTEIASGISVYTISDGTNTTTYTVDFSQVTNFGAASEEGTEEIERVTAPQGTVTWGNVSWDANANINISGPTTESDGSVSYTVSGTASQFVTEDQVAAAAFPDGKIGDYYVYLVVLVKPGETLTYKGTETFTNTETYDDYGYFIVRVNSTTEWTFSIDGVDYTVYFENVVPADEGTSDTTQVSSAEEFATALEAGKTNITLTADITDENSTVITALNTVLADAAAKDDAVIVIINLGGFTLDTSSSNYGIVVGNYNTLEINGDQGKLILWTNETSNSPKSDGAIYVDSASTLIINDTIVTSTGTAIFPRADTSKVEVNGSVIYTTGYYGISTNAGTGMSDKVVIDITNSLVYANESGNDCAAVMLNVEGTLKVTGSYIVGGRQGIILRANDSAAVIKDSVIAVSGDYASSPYANEDGTPTSDKKWSSGNEVPNAAVVLGDNYSSTSYDGTTTVEFDGVTLEIIDTTTTASAYFLLYAYSNKDGNSVVITMSGTNNFSVEYLGLNEGVYAGVGEGGSITVGNAVLTEKSEDENDEENQNVSSSIDFTASTTYSSLTGILTSYTYGKTETSEGTTKDYVIPDGSGVTTEDGLITVVGTNGTSATTDGTFSSTPMYFNTDRLTCAGATSTNSGSEGRYIQLNLSAYVGKTVSISVVMSSSGESTARSLILSKTIQTNTTGDNTLAYVSSTSNSNGKVTLTYVGTIEETVLYLTWNNNINLYSISAEIGSDLQKGPSVTSVTIASVDNATIKVNDETNDSLTLTVGTVTTSDGSTYANGYTWEVVEGESYVSLKAGSSGTSTTVTAVAAGTAKIKVTVWYDGGSCSSAEITITIEAGGEEA